MYALLVALFLFYTHPKPKPRPPCLPVTATDCRKSNYCTLDSLVTSNLDFAGTVASSISLSLGRLFSFTTRASTGFDRSPRLYSYTRLAALEDGLIVIRISGPTHTYRAAYDLSIVVYSVNNHVVCRIWFRPAPTTRFGTHQCQQLFRIFQRRRDGEQERVRSHQ